MSRVPSAYRVIFFLFDFLMPLGGSVAHVIAPRAILGGLAVAPSAPPAVETQMLLDSLAGWFVGLALLHTYLQLARPSDRRAWVPVIAAVFVQDIFQLGGFARAMHTEGRTLVDTSTWRNEDWSNLGGYAFIALVRLLFVMSTSAQESAAKKKSA